MLDLALNSAGNLKVELPQPPIYLMLRPIISARASRLPPAWGSASMRRG
jgi:hypothetical protein